MLGRLKKMTSKTIERERISQEELIEKVPAVIAEQPMAGASNRYNFIRTIEIVKLFEKKGWFVRYAEASRVPEHSIHYGFQTHVIRFSPEKEKLCILDEQGNLEAFPEIILTNSHNRYTSFKIDMGLFRLVCANGMVTGESFMGQMKVKHLEDYSGLVDTTVQGCLQTIPSIMERVRSFRQVDLTTKQQINFAKKSIALRWDLESLEFAPKDFLQRTREEDKGNDLWKTFNVIQDKLIKGGSFAKVKGEEKEKTVTLKAMQSPKEILSVNKRLWDMAEKYATN